MLRDSASSALFTGYTLQNSPTHLLHRAQQRASDNIASVLRECGITPRQYVLMLMVKWYPGTTQASLVEATGIDRSTMADMVARLQKRGLLSTKKAPRDLRASSVALTDDGQAAMSRAIPLVNSVEQQFLDQIPEQIRGEFVSCLQLLGRD